MLVEYRLDSNYGIPDRPRGGVGETECLGGQRAMAEFRNEPYSHRYVVEIYFPDLGVRLIGSAPDAQRRAQLLAAFRTIRFHDYGAWRTPIGPVIPLPMEPSSKR